MNVLKNLKPAKLFEFFELLSSVPHGSGNTKQISDLCVGFAKERGLEYYQDEMNNVIIYKPATVGYENEETVILQGHLDMVCAKTDDCKIDMTTEPIKLMTDGEWVWADKTSLGSDDCIGVAAAMAVLDDDNLEHPALEAVFTVDEETGMFGAHALDASRLKGRRMLNIDGGEGFFVAGCAGGQRANIALKIRRDAQCEKMLANTAFAEVTVDGLMGGHSGEAIHLERANANVIMARLLYNVSKRVGIRICAIEGGKVDNAITQKNVAKIAIPRSAYRTFSDEIKRYALILKEEYRTSDPELRVSVLGCRYSEDPVCREDTLKILGLVTAMPYGVQNMSVEIPGLVETSLNLGIIRLEGDTFNFSYAMRSAVKSRKEMLADKVKVIGNAFGATVTYMGDYPCWTFRKESAMRDRLAVAYREVFGKEPEIGAIHGGLECGILIDKMPGLDCVSIGADHRDIHSARERVGVKSVEEMYRMLCVFLGIKG